MGKTKFDIFNTMQRDKNNTDFSNLYSIFYQQLYNIATNLFTWEGLPNSIRSTFWETILATNGIGCITNTDDFGLIMSACSVRNSLNIYGNPTAVTLTPFSNQFYELKNIDLQTQDFVVCYNDNTGLGLLNMVDITARSMANVYESIISNANQQRFPTIIQGDENSKMSYEIVTSKVEGCEPFILMRNTNKSALDLDNTKIINQNIPFVCDKLNDTLNDLFNKFLSFCGINNLQCDKKERLIVDEVNINNESLDITKDTLLNNRLYFCEQANKLYNLNISVERNPIDL